MNAKYHINTKHLTINEGPNPGTPRTESGKYDIQAEEAVVNEFRSKDHNATYQVLQTLAEDTTPLPTILHDATPAPTPTAHAPLDACGTSSDHDPSASLYASLPADVASPEAMLLWQRLHKAGIVDAHFRPVPDLQKKDIMWIAKTMSAHLFPNDKPHWKPFEQYWGTKRLNQEYFYYNETGRKPDKAKDIERALNP